MTELYGTVIPQLALTAVLSTFCLICWYYWSHRKILHAAWKVPKVSSFPAYPIVGHGYIALRGHDYAVNFLLNHARDQVIEGTLNKLVFWIGPYPLFFIGDPEDIKIILTSSKSSLEGGIAHAFVGVLLGNGLVSAPVHVWKVTRRHVNVMFHPRNLELLYPVLNECGRDLVASLTQHVGTGLVDVEPLVDPIALKSTCKLVFGKGVEFDMESNKFRNFLGAIHRGSQLCADRFLKIYAWPEPLFKLLYRRDIKQLEDSFNMFINEAIKVSREVTNKKHDDNEATDERVQTILEDTYKIILEQNPSFTEKDLNYEIRTILAAGSESTRVTMSSCLLALAADPHIQEKLYSEIMSVTGPQDSDVTPEDIRAMPYLDQVLKETLRFFNVIPFFPKRVQEDVKLRDWTIPKGSHVLVCTYGVHFNPKLYPDPMKFDPDRFSPENVAARGDNSFIPFSGGPRNCIGKNYSMMVLKTLLVHVVRRFKLSTTEDININSRNITAGIIMSYKDGYKVEIKLRDDITFTDTNIPFNHHS